MLEPSKHGHTCRLRVLWPPPPGLRYLRRVQSAPLPPPLRDQPLPEASIAPRCPIESTTPPNATLACVSTGDRRAIVVQYGIPCVGARAPSRAGSWRQFRSFTGPSRQNGSERIMLGQRSQEWHRVRVPPLPSDTTTLRGQDHRAGRPFKVDRVYAVHAGYPWSRKRWVGAP